MQPEVAHSGVTKFTVEFDSETVVDTMKHRHMPALCMRTDLELPQRIPYGLFDVLPGEAVFTSNKRPRTSKRVDTMVGSFPRAMSALNGLLAANTRNANKLSNESHAKDYVNFFGAYTFIGIATTPCKSRMGQWDHFVVACQGLVLLKMDADAVFGDTIIVDLPTSVHKADMDESRATASMPHLSAPRQKQTLVFRPCNEDEEIQGIAEFEEEGNKLIKEGEALGARAIFSSLKHLYDAHRIRRVGRCVSNTPKGKLAKVVLYTTAF